MSCLKSVKKNGRKTLTIFVVVTAILLFSPLSISQIKSGSPEELTMNPLDVAPWSGVLVPYERYLYYKEELEVCKYKEANQPSCPNQQYEIMPWAFTGAVVGFLLGIQAR